jgi:hypothetical protein
LIRFEQVFKRYPGGREALSGVDMSMESGEMAFLTGRSGAGKSTMLKLIGLLERPTRGQVIVDGRNTGGIGRRQIPAFRRQIGMVFQDHKLLHDRTVYDNVALPLVIRGMSGKEIGKRVRAALDQVGLLHTEKVKPMTLSTGEQQRAHRQPRPPSDPSTRPSADRVERGPPDRRGGAPCLGPWPARRPGDPSVPRDVRSRRLVSGASGSPASGGPPSAVPSWIMHAYSLRAWAGSRPIPFRR